MTGVIRRRYAEYIIVMERMSSRRIHYHLLVVMAEDIRTGFDFAAVAEGRYSSASAYLRSEWAFWRRIAPKYGFGRTELLPVKKTAAGVVKYVGKYIAKHIGKRLREDKGARLVRYSKRANRLGIRFSWVSVGAFEWRTKLGLFCQTLNLNPDNYKAHLREWFGRNWVYMLRPVIESIKMPEFHSEEEVRISLRSAWVVAVNERERRRPKRQSDFSLPAVNVEDFKLESPRAWASWLERSVKED
jgi:hypothetical protein